MLQSIPADVDVVLVDNASDDRAALDALAKDHSARLILNPDNIGFGPACNLGAAKAETEFLLFLNPDAALQTGAIDAFIQATKDHPKASGFNPRILDGKGKQSFRRGSKLRPKERLKGPVPKGDTELPVLVGSGHSVFKTQAGQERGLYERRIKCAERRRATQVKVRPTPNTG
jgi:GT2 family glycosyltransferase